MAREVPAESAIATRRLVARSTESPMTSITNPVPDATVLPATWLFK